MKNKWLITGLVVVLIFCISWSKSTDFSQDLGRHLKLGEIIVTTKHIPTTNLFSYTNAVFPFINHHWLTEVIYYLLVSAFGLPALFVLRSFLLTGSVLLSLKARQKQSYYLASIVSFLIFLPLLVERIEIRPEHFGYFFFSLFLYIIFFKKDTRLQYILPAVMFLWTNLHISFVFGLFLIGIGGIRAWRNKQPVYGYALGLAAALLNPHGINGAVEPFLIFRNYGYSIVENQNIFFLLSATFNPALRYYLYLSPFVLVALAVLLQRRKFAGSFILATFYLLGMWQVRHISFFVLAAMFFVPLAIEYTYEEFRQLPISRQWKRIPADWVVSGLLGAAILITYSGIPNLIYDNPRSFGYGFYEEEKQATDFILEHHLPGRLFNNFDIGGYAIYRLYPQYSVFVDNRPEAYPADFFQQVYIPMQETDDLRKELFKQYGIHTILFAHTDGTPWGRLFASHILNDPSWKLIYYNSSVFVMSDKTDLPDIRTDTNFLRKQIDNAKDSSALIHYASFLSLLKMDNLVREVMQKAREINPYSCTVKRYDYDVQTSVSYILNGTIQEKAWWCY